MNGIITLKKYLRSAYKYHLFAFRGVTIFNTVMITFMISVLLLMWFGVIK
jgi:hypothetical protein